MVRFIALILILITFYWVSMLKYISRTKIKNNTEEAPFVIPGERTEPENYLRVKPIVEIKIGFLRNSTSTLVTKLIWYCNQSFLA